MEQLKVRCPACQKLYLVDTSAIHSQTPYFECKACQSVFAFEFPPADLQNVESFLVSHYEETSVSQAEKSESKDVVLEARPSLVQLWNQIFEDYDDHERHEDFVKRCRELDALPFAKLKYESLIAALGRDEVCDKFLKQVEAMMEVKAQHTSQSSISSDAVEVKKVWEWLKAKNTKRVIYWTPLVISLCFVVLGLSNLNLRNMIGVGFAIAFLSYGLITVFRGPLKLSDFLD